MLSDLGAEVIKVEAPEGDLGRDPSVAPYRGASGLFLTFNRNKKSVVINLKTDSGREVFYQLVKVSDVVVDNFRSGVLERLKADYPTLSRVNPRIIQCSVTGFGAEGAYKDFPALDIIIQAISGHMAITGEPGRPPARVGVPLADLSGGIFSCKGILAALFARERSGRGARVEISMFDVMLNLLSYMGTMWLTNGELPQPPGSAHDYTVPWQAFSAKDGYIVVATREEPFWRRLCELLEDPGLADDPRFDTNANRVRHKDVLVPRLVEIAITTGDPDATLGRGLDLLEVIARRTAYLALLEQYPQALAKVAQVIGSASWAAQYLRDHPILLDELIDPSLLEIKPDWQAFHAELVAMLDAVEPGNEINYSAYNGDLLVYRTPGRRTPRGVAEVADREAFARGLDAYVDAVRITREALRATVHSRDAADETAAALAGFAGRVVLHCFSSPDLLEPAVDRGYYVSFAGNVTYPRAADLRAAAQAVPADRLLAETDSPYLAPQPVRGRPNEPANVMHTVRVLADARGVDADELADSLAANAAAAFGLHALGAVGIESRARA